MFDDIDITSNKDDIEDDDLLSLMDMASKK